MDPDPVSDVVRLRASIAAEAEAMKQGLSGIAEGVARHAFLSAKMWHIDGLRLSLASHIGEEQSIDFVARLVCSEEQSGAPPP